MRCLGNSRWVSASHRRFRRGRTTKAQSGTGVEGRVLCTVCCKRIKSSVQRTLNTEDVARGVEGRRDRLTIFEKMY